VRVVAEQPLDGIGLAFADDQRVVEQGDLPPAVVRRHDGRGTRHDVARYATVRVAQVGSQPQECHIRRQEAQALDIEPRCAALVDGREDGVVASLDGGPAAAVMPEDMDEVGIRRERRGEGSCIAAVPCILQSGNESGKSGFVAGYRDAGAQVATPKSINCRSTSPPLSFA